GPEPALDLAGDGAHDGPLQLPQRGIVEAAQTRHVPHEMKPVRAGEFHQGRETLRGEHVDGVDGRGPGYPPRPTPWLAASRAISKGSSRESMSTTNQAPCRSERMWPWNPIAYWRAQSRSAA